MIYALGDRIPQVAEDAYVAPGARVIGDVHIGAQASIWFGAVLRGDIERLTIGPGTNIQDNSVLHSDAGIPLVLGTHITVGHGVTLHGCQVGDGSLIGIGAIVMNGARIGARSIVGAGALVTEGKQFRDGVLILGTPARVARELSAAELDMLTRGAQHYIERGQLYRQTLRPV